MWRAVRKSNATNPVLSFHDHHALGTDMSMGWTAAEMVWSSRMLSRVNTELVLSSNLK